MFKVNLLSNKKAFERFVLLQFTIVMMCILIFYKVAYTYIHIIEQNILLNVVYGIVGFSILYFIHEFIHNMMFRLLSKGQKPAYQLQYGLLTTHMPNVYFKKWQYLTIMLAPLVIITLILFIVFSNFAFSSIIFMMSFHVGYCVFDLYFLKGVFNSEVKYIEDTTEGIVYYTQAPMQVQTDFK